MKKGEIYQGIIERFVYPDKGTLVTEAGNITVKHGLPGQRVTVMITKQRGGRMEGRILEILEKSPLETNEHPCIHSGSCGGCIYQTVPYEEQLKLKESQVRGLLEEVCGPFEFQGILPSPMAECYRNKMEFSFGDEFKDGPLALGLHRRGSFYDVVNTTQCRIVDSDFCELLQAAKVYFTEQGLGFYKKMKHEGYLRHLLVRKAVKTKEILVDLVTTSQEEPDLKPFADLLLSLPLKGRITGILHTFNDSFSDAIINDKTEILYGDDFFYEELLGLRFKITPFSFFQTNSLGAEVLYEKARGYVGDTKDLVVFDLYSGTGTIAQMIAPVAKKVVGVEIVEEAVEAARENARLNGLANCRFIAGDVLKVLDDIEEKPDLIILDPPRDGIHPKALDRIMAYGVDRIVYISCKPTSLARDLVKLRAGGYEVVKGGGVDLFPGNVHVETCVLLTLKDRRMKPTYHIELEIPMETKDEYSYRPKERQATYPKIKEYIKDTYGANVHTKDIAEVKGLCGLEKRLNYNKSKKAEPKARHCIPEKAEYIKSALNHFGVLELS